MHRSKKVPLLSVMMDEMQPTLIAEKIFDKQKLVTNESATTIKIATDFARDDNLRIIEGKTHAGGKRINIENEEDNNHSFRCSVECEI